MHSSFQFNSGLDLKTIQKAKAKGMGAIRRYVLWLLMNCSDPSDARGLTKGSGPDIPLQLL